MQCYGIGKTAMYRSSTAAEATKPSWVRRLMKPSAPPVYVTRIRLMFLAKVDVAALILHSFSAGVMGLLLVSAGVVGDGSTLAHLLSIVLFVVKSGTVLRVLL